MTVAVVKNSEGTPFVVHNIVKNSAGTPITVSNSVKNSAGTPFLIFGDTISTPTPTGKVFTVDDDRTFIA